MIISACYLGSAQTNSTQVLKDVHRGKYQLVYLTPEYITNCHSFLKQLNRNVDLTLVAIDEAHCVSEWGHDFRSSYRQLGFIRNVVPDIPIITFTATATPIVRNDICVNLNLKNPIVRCTGFDRKNLYFCVQRKSTLMGDLKLLMIKKFENGHRKYSFLGTAIIYCPTRNATEEVTQTLVNFGIKCEAYHAGLDLERRKNTQHKFIRDELDVCNITVLL